MNRITRISSIVLPSWLRSTLHQAVDFRPSSHCYATKKTSEKDTVPHDHHRKHEPVSHATHHEQHIEEKPIVGPGAPPGVIPTSYEQAPGLERIEYLADIQGVNVFLTDPLKIDHYGTLGAPILVESIEGERIIGCTGFPKYSHEILWMKLNGFDHPHRCVDCGQAFKLIPAKLVFVEGVNAPPKQQTATTLAE